MAEGVTNSFMGREVRITFNGFVFVLFFMNFLLRNIHYAWGIHGDNSN
jgi:hypothetical protein